MEKFLKVMLIVTVIANGLSIIGIARKLERCIVVPDGYRVEAKIVSDDWPTYISRPDKTFALYFIKEGVECVPGESNGEDDLDWDCWNDCREETLKNIEELRG